MSNLFSTIHSNLPVELIETLIQSDGVGSNGSSPVVTHRQRGSGTTKMNMSG